MAQAAAAEETSKPDETPEQPEPVKSGGRRKLILLAAAPVALLGVCAGLWFSGVLPRLLGMQHAETPTEQATPLKPIYVDLPELIANLNSNPQRPSYVKLTARLEVTEAGRRGTCEGRHAATAGSVPDLHARNAPAGARGSAGTYRLREELIARANLAAAPARITDVLFTQMLVQ